MACEGVAHSVGLYGLNWSKVHLRGKQVSFSFLSPCFLSRYKIHTGSIYCQSTVFHLVFLMLLYASN